MQFNISHTAARIFSIIDIDADGWLDFYDFGFFMEVTYIFAKLDELNAGRLAAGDLFEKLSTYSEFPVASYHMRERARLFNLFPKDLRVDVLNTILILRIEEIIMGAIRRSDKNTMFEYELKAIFHQVGMISIPDSVLNKCLRGTDEDNVPLYDWECAFVNSMTGVLKYYENSYAYLLVTAKNLTLTNTVFINIDPKLNITKGARA